MHIPQPARAPLSSFALAAAFVLAMHLFFGGAMEDAAIEIDTPAESTTVNADNGEGEDITTAAITTAVVQAQPEPPTAQKQEEDSSWRHYRIRRNDRMHIILPKIGASEEAVRFFLNQKFKSYRKLRRGATIDYRQNTDGDLVRLRYKTGADYYLTAERGIDGKWAARENPPALTTLTVAQGGRIEKNSSLYESAKDAGIGDIAIDALIGALDWHIDFFREQRENDAFKMVYEKTVDEDGELIGAPVLLAYQYESHLRRTPRIFEGLWNVKEGGYYSPDGESMQGAFLRAPLEYRRISSRFGRRKHPVLKKWRAHKGVDYAAPTGTPVRATADGEIVRLRKERGYGNVVFIKHYDIYTTVYGHLHGFAKGMRRGRKVRQGDIIGYVGSTGLSTGPHLHYEFRIRGVHKDPLSSALPRRLPPLDKKALAAFQTQAQDALGMLAAAEV
ncbi:MAG: M23 family metallopeptidase [Gammaproteobacteria bacterium]